jgi:hypothetical protein
MVREWNSGTWELSETRELFVKRGMDFGNFTATLGQKFPHIPLENLECTKINSVWNFHRVQLPHEKWVKLTEATGYLNSAPFFLSTDGLLFIVKDSSHIERDLTMEERILFGFDEWESSMASTTSSSFSGKKNYNFGGEKALHITVKK